MARILPGSALLALSLAVPASCSGVSFRSDVAARVATVDRARLREHVEALDAIGPRPVSDADATRAAVDDIAGRLRPLGYELKEETFPVALSGSLVAIVRPADRPDAEPSEIQLDPELGACGPQAMRAKSRELGDGGWEVEGYRMSGTQPQARVVPDLIATRRGTSDSSSVVEVCAHYDTVPYCPGADDDSSGVAALLEIARVLATATTRKTVRLCFFGAEEMGELGSRAHLAEIAARPEQRIAGLIALDPVGFTARGRGTQRKPPGAWFLPFPSEADFLVVVGKGSSGWLGNLLEGAIDAYAPELRYSSANRLGALFRDAYRSDHAGYWRAGYPAILLTDTGDYRNATYHSPNDVPATIDYAFLESVTRATAAAVLHLAELEAPSPEP